MLNLMQQYKLGAGDMAKISDVLANALANTSFQGDELAETMKFAGLSGATLGWSLEETVAATDAVIKRVGDASMAGTYFRQVIAAMLDPTEKMKEELARVGLSLDDVARALEDPIQLSRFLGEAQRRGANFATMFSVRAADAGRALANTEIPALQKTIEVLGETGTAHEMAGKKAEGWAGQWAALTAAFHNLRISLGEALKPLTPVLGIITAFVNKLAEFARTPVLVAGTALITLSGFVTALGALKMGLAAVTGAQGIGALASGLQATATAAPAAAAGLSSFASAAGPIALAAAAATALSIALVTRSQPLQRLLYLSRW